MSPTRRMHEVAIRHPIGGRDVDVGFRHGLGIRGPRKEPRQPRSRRHGSKVAPCQFRPTHVLGVIGIGSVIAHECLLADRALFGGGGSFPRRL